MVIVRTPSVSVGNYLVFKYSKSNFGNFFCKHMSFKKGGKKNNKKECILVALSTRVALKVRSFWANKNSHAIIVYFSGYPHWSRVNQRVHPLTLVETEHITFWSFRQYALKTSLLRVRHQSMTLLISSFNHAGINPGRIIFKLKVREGTVCTCSSA